MCDASKQFGWNCVWNHEDNPCKLQGRTASSQGNLDKSRLVPSPRLAVVTA